MAWGKTNLNDNSQLSTGWLVILHVFDVVCVEAIRQMIERKKKTVEGRLVRHNITDGYADFGSQAYAPLTRIGVFRDRHSDQYVVKNKYLANYAGWCRPHRESTLFGDVHLFSCRLPFQKGHCQRSSFLSIFSHPVLSFLQPSSLVQFFYILSGHELGTRIWQDKMQTSDGHHS